MSAEQIQHSEVSTNTYADLVDIASQMHQVEKDYGLRDDQYWPIDDAPAKYKRLDKQYNKIMSREFARILCRLHLNDIADLWQRKTSEFNRLREIGRAAVFDKEDIERATLSTVIFYEKEAELCKRAKAYYAACVMLGSAAEARLLAACISHPEKTRAAIGKLPLKSKVRGTNPLEWSFHELVLVARSAEWLVDLDDGNITHVTSAWVGELRNTRNFVHPSVHVRRRPHIVLGEETLKDAECAYTALRFSLDHSCTSHRPVTA